MPDDQQQNAGDQQNGQQDSGNKPDGKYSPSTLEEAMRIIGALSKRVEERESDANRYKTERDNLTAAQRKQLEEDGKFRTIAEQQAVDLARLKPIEERATALEKIIRDSNEARIKNVPDQYKNMIPLEYAPEKLQAWLNANEALLVKPPAPNYDAGAGGSGSGNKPNEPKVTDEDRRQAAIAQANGHNVKPEDIAKRRVEMAKAANNGNQ